ncbi:MAG: hypothetical protein K6C32_03855 [Bacilli bacterium]|nr:hypothetical protein [Bacilli bacterium]
MKISSYNKEGLNFIEVLNGSLLKVVFCNLGASIFNIYFCDEQMTRNVKNIKDYKLPTCYYGKTIGRTCNRFKGNKLDINGNLYTLEPNEGENVLHGGVNGLSNKRFKSTINTYSSYVEVVFTYLSPHLEGGYPGNLNLEVKYVVYKSVNKIDISYTASSDMDTFLALTNHSYYSLGDIDISNIELRINGYRYLKTDYSSLLPVEILDVDEVRDFSKYKKITDHIDSELLKGKMMNGYDTYWYFDEVKINKPNVSIRNQKYLLNVYTDFEGTQIYSSNYEPSFDLSSKFKYRDSVAIEPSDSFYKPAILLKGKTYRRNISLEFKKNK